MNGRDSEKVPLLHDGSALDGMTAAQWLRRARKCRRLTQVQLAERSGVSKNHVSLLERGERALSTVDTVVRLADGLKIAREQVWLVALREFERKERARSKK
ncbi:helix-turn-helix domain-containing protein [Amycolatopsis sp. cmx-11-12]|uniref:helix-turn-helix domain-containing protein n=1 Tax=Amycolatopsis sp. cmx-11-12 TaxID=2785795 RepID=UPI003917D750